MFEKDLLGLKYNLRRFEFFEPRPEVIPSKSEQEQPSLHSLMQNYSQIEHLNTPDCFYECPKCNSTAREEQVKNDLKSQKGKTEPLRDEWKRIRTIKTPAIMRTMLFDIPENLLINLKRYNCMSRYTNKIQGLLEYESTIYLDDLMIHRIQKDNEKIVQNYQDCRHNDVDDYYEGKYRPRYKYNLIAVLSHIGEYHLGHYVAFIRFKHMHS